MVFVVDKAALGQVFLQVLRFSPCQYNSTNATYSSSSLYDRDKQAGKSLGTFKESKAKYQGAWTEK
jgi:hypothetical protein